MDQTDNTQMVTEQREVVPEPFVLKHPCFAQDIPIVQFVKEMLQVDNLEDLVNKLEEKDLAQTSAQALYEPRPLQEISQTLTDLGITFPSPCGKPIENNQYFYRCLDCDKFSEHDSTFITVICQECFDRSNHVGHRVFMTLKDNESTGICDCGDTECLKEEGFCDKHRYLKVNPEEILEKFPSGIKEPFLNKFHDAFYTRISLIEELISQQLQKEQQKIKFISFSIINITRIATELIQAHKAFITLVSFLFRNPLPKGKNLVYHECDNLKVFKLDNELHECKCTMLELYCRFVQFSLVEMERDYTDLFTELIRDELFKIHLSETFSRFIYFLVPKRHGTENHKQFPPVHDLFRMGAQIFGSESLFLLTVHNRSIENFFGCLARTIESFLYPGEVISNQIDEIGSIIGYAFTPSQKAAGFELIHKMDYFKRVFELLMTYNIKISYYKKIGIGTLPPDIDYKLMNNLFLTSRSLEYLVEKGYRAIQYETNDKKKELMLLILKEWNTCFQNVTTVIEIELENESNRLFYPTFERMLTLMLTSYIKPLSQKYLRDFLSEALQLNNPEELSSFGQRFAKNVLNNFGVFRYLQMIHNYQQGPLHTIYLFINNLMHEHDIIALQMSTLLADQVDIFEYFSNSFFTYSPEIANFLTKGEKLVEDERIKHKYIVIEDYLAMINFIMSDELCYLSSQVGKKNHTLIETSEFEERYYKTTKRLLINLMAVFYWTTLKKVKDSLRNLIKEYEFTEKIIQEISDINSENYQIRLKDQYLKEFDPYFFFKSRAMQRNVVNAYINRDQKAKIDSVSGQFYTDLPQYLYNIQVKFFSSSLLSTLKRLILEWNEEYPHILTIALRLVYFNLELINFLQTDEKQLLTEKFISAYAESAFIEKLQIILKNENLKEFAPCIKKIFKRLKDLNEHFRQLIPVELLEAEAVDSPLLDKKALAQERMKKLQQQFSEKQKIFASKNLNEIQNASGQELVIEESKEDLDEKCQHCLEPIKNGKTYGVPVYLTFANNFAYPINSDHFKISQENYHQNFEELYPITTSCNHMFHEECYGVIYKKIWEPQNFNKNQTMYTNFFENNCPVCKTLVNTFLPLSFESKQKSDKIEEELQSKPEVSQTVNGTQNTQNESEQRTGVQSEETTPENEIEIEEDEEEKIEVEEPKPQEIKKRPLDFIDKFTKLISFSQNRNPFDIIKEPTTIEFSKLKNAVKQAVVYFLESTHLYSETEIKQRFFLVFHLLRNYYFKLTNGVLPPGVLSAAINFEDCPLPLYSFFMFTNQTEFEEKIRLFNNFIEILCTKLLTTIILNLDYAREYLKRLVFMIIRGMALAVTSFGEKKEFQHISDILSSNSIFKHKFFEMIQYPIVSVTYLYLSLSAQNLKQEDWKETESQFKILFNNQIEDEDFFNEILKIYQEENFTLDQILKAQNNKLEDPKGNEEMKSLSKRTQESMILEFDFVNSFEVKRKAPFFVSIPSTYFDFNEKYLTTQCMICKEHKSTSNICLCLICGHVICRRSCDVKAEPRVGNLTLHTTKYHACSSVFLNIKDLVIYFIGTPEIIVYSSNIYVDAFGMSFQDLQKEMRLKSLDFKRLTLNKKLMQTIKEISDTTFRIPQTVNKIIRESQYKIKPAYY